MSNGMPGIPNPTAQQRKDWEQIKVSNRAGADRAPLNSRTGSLRDLVEQAQRETRERADEGSRENDGTRTRTR